MSEPNRHAALEHASDVYSTTEIETFKQAGLWRDTLLTDYLDEHARRRGEETAVVAGEDRMSWTELATSVDRLAAGFVQLGLRPGDYVAIQLPNTVEFVQTYLAVQRAGLRAVTLMPLYREQDVTFMLARCKARAYVVPHTYRGFDHASLAMSLRTKLQHLDTVVVADTGAPEGTVSLHELLTTAPLSTSEYVALRPDPDSASKVSFTSGTTGRPKGVVHTHNTDLVTPRLLAEALAMTPDTPLWMPSPVTHVTGLIFGLYPAMVAGAKLVLQDRWDAEVALDLISRERAVLTVSATPFIAAMLDVHDPGRFDISSFKYFVSGGARVPPHLVERASSELGIQLLRAFGGAEAPLHALNPPDAPWEKMTGRDGKTFPQVQNRVVSPDDHTTVLPSGVVGEYSSRGAHVFLGYMDEPELTAEARDDEGWFHSGDLCQIDDEGYVLYVDRLKDIINRGGVKISAMEVENELLTHPHVLHAAVVAVPDDVLGERSCAYVTVRAGATLDLKQVQEHLEGRGVTTQKWPEYLRVLDALPMTATGKVLKAQLRTEHVSSAR